MNIATIFSCIFFIYPETSDYCCCWCDSHRRFWVGSNLQGSSSPVFSGIAHTRDWTHNLMLLASCSDQLREWEMTASAGEQWPFYQQWLLWSLLPGWHLSYPLFSSSSSASLEEPYLTEVVARPSLHLRAQRKVLLPVQENRKIHEQDGCKKEEDRRGRQAAAMGEWRCWEILIIGTSVSCWAAVCRWGKAQFYLKREGQRKWKPSALLRGWSLRRRGLKFL